jgi:hypothetical protein
MAVYFYYALEGQEPFSEKYPSSQIGKEVARVRNGRKTKGSEASSDNSLE